MNYEESLKDYRDMYSVIKTAEHKGREEGIAIGEERGIAIGEERGIAIGMQKEKLANARTLKQNGVPADIIAKSLGLSHDEIKDL